MDFFANIREAYEDEIHEISKLLSVAYYDDIFFKWCVPDDKERLNVVKEYYEVYLKSRGCISHVALNENDKIIGATVWLPHDADESIYTEIERVAQKDAPQFASVAEKSHKNEPKGIPFYQLVGFGVVKSMQGFGVGIELLKHNLNIQDKAGIDTYLEASTPFTGGGVYGKFGYKPYGDFPMKFAENAVLYPLYRKANNNK